MGNLVLRNIVKKFNDSTAVDIGSLEIDEGEFIVLLGPSGCGKTTTLRLIAGLESPTEGEILFNDQVVNALSPKERNIAMVFQDYALYPHMRVYDNIALNLRVDRVPRDEIDRRVREVAGLLNIEHLLGRKPRAMSGGQQQRVALGRAIVRNPKYFLMDEPLSNLDAKLRLTMRSEIKKLHNRLGTTTIYVTHDQEEAMVIADRIVILKDGRIQQAGSPREIYEHPQSRFVANFIGSPEMNFLNCRVDPAEKGTLLLAGGLRLLLPPDGAEAMARANLPGEVILGIRPKNVKTGYQVENPDGAGEVTFFERLGEVNYVHFNILGAGSGASLIARWDADDGAAPGDKVQFRLDRARIHLFDPADDMSLLENALRRNRSTGSLAAIG